MAQLREYEPIYQAQKTLKSKQQQCLLRQTTKRTIHQMDTERTEDKCDTMDSWLLFLKMLKIPKDLF